MCFFRKKKRVGLVLGSGGARGLAHIGVIKAMVNNKIPIDLIVGSSAGALMGGLYASWKAVDELEKLATELTIKDLAEVLVDLGWGGGLIKGGKTLEFLKKKFNGEKIENLKIPFAAVATDIHTGEEVVFREGDVAEAVRASISVPLFYTPVVYNGRTLVDGGVSCPVPVEVAIQMGADIVIAVNLDSVYFSRENRGDGEKINKSTVDILKDSYFALRYNLAKKEVREANVVIEPEMEYIHDFDFTKGEKIITAGERAVEKELSRIKRLL
jgi:NTE family protein